MSLAHEQFIKGKRYSEFLRNADNEIDRFRRACVAAKIPDISAKKSLKDVLEWSLHILASWRPKVTYKSPDNSGDLELDLFGTKLPAQAEEPELKAPHPLPQYVNDVKEALERVLEVSRLSLWLMVDRLDEIFPRRSDVERTALRGILRAMRYFSSPHVRVKVFLRDDMLDQVVRTPEGFTALTHLTVRSADTLRWTQDHILAMVVKRFFANDALRAHLQINQEQLDASSSYRAKCFRKIFPPTVFRGPKQSPTIRWIYNRCADGRGVVTPRDVLDLLIRARQRQQDIYQADPEGTSEWLISPAAIRYGFEELSRRKRQTYLEAEFPHLWRDIEKFSGGKTDYSSAALQKLLGSKWKATTDDLVDVGFLAKRGGKKGSAMFSIPFLYRHGMNLTQGTA